VGSGLLALNHGEDAQWDPLAFRRGLGLLACVGDGGGLLGVLLGGADVVAVHVDRAVIAVDDLTAVVVAGRILGVAATAGHRAPAGRAPGRGRGPLAREPVTGTAPPGTAEVVPADDPSADICALAADGPGLAIVSAASPGSDTGPRCGRSAWPGRDAGLHAN